MTAWLWFPAALVVAAFTLAAILVVLAPKPSRVTPPTETFDDHVETALTHTSATPLFDELALERLRLALEDWGKEDVA